VLDLLALSTPPPNITNFADFPKANRLSCV
jgi:hypothetical protein